MFTPGNAIEIFENLTEVLEKDLWIETTTYDCYIYDEHNTIIPLTGRKQFPIYEFYDKRSESTITVVDKNGKPFLDLQGNEIFIDKETVGTGDESIQIAIGTFYNERLKQYAEFLDIVRDLRLTLFYHLAANKHNFTNNLWKLLFEIRSESQARFTKIFLNMFFTTYNPMFDESSGEDNAPESTPFILFDFQYKFVVEAIENPMSLLVIKPRGFGFTWLKIGIDLVNMLFTKNWQGIVISRVESDLDIKDDRVQTIFGRMRYAIEHFPFSVIQYGKDKQRFIKLANGSQYMGKSSNVDSARSMRGTLVELEEAGAMDKLTEMVRSIKSVAKKRIIGGSVKGTDNGFYEFYQNALTDGSYKIILWKTWEHPLYSAPDWLQAELESYGGDIAGFNQEVMADFFAGVEGQVFIALHNGFLMDRKSFKDINTSEYWIKCSSIDPAFGTSKTAIWTYYFNSLTREYFYTGYYEMVHTNYTKIIELMKNIGYLDSISFIDEHANKRDKDGTTLSEMLKKLGMINLMSVSNQKVLQSCFFANNLINSEKIFFDIDGVNIKNNRKHMRVGGFDKLLRYRYNNNNGISKNSRSIIDKDGKNDDAGDSFRYSHWASKYIGKGVTNKIFNKKKDKDKIYYTV